MSKQPKKITAKTLKKKIERPKKEKKAIEDEKFKKLVFERPSDDLLRINLDIIVKFDRLKKAYPEAFVSLVSIPGMGRGWVPHRNY